MAILWNRTRQEIRESKMKNFRIVFSLYGAFFLFVGLFSEIVFWSGPPIKLVTSVVFALTGVFLFVMVFGGLRKTKPLQAKAWEIYPMIIVAMFIISPFVGLSVLQSLAIGLKMCVPIAAIHMFCLSAILCRKKYADRRRY